MSDLATKWATPKMPDPVDLAFGPKKLADWLPNFHDLPEEFQRERHPMCEVVQQWFFRGLGYAACEAKPGIDKDWALGHIAVCLKSFEPKHEHKIAGCGYLMSLWFEKAKAKGKKGSR